MSSKTNKVMKRVRIGWAIVCAAIDIALVVLVCMEWSKNGSPWWILVLAGVIYTIGAIVGWAWFDDILKAAQEREEGDIYYGPQDEY